MEYLKMKTLALLVCTMALLSCGRREAPSVVESQKQIAQANTANLIPVEAPKVNKDSATKIARDDFIRNLGRQAMKDMEATATQEGDRWRVSIHAKPTILLGGGAVYSVDQDTGAILDRKFYQ
jgi:hypothetical protein